jgi:TPR repeat protein
VRVDFGSPLVGVSLRDDREIPYLWFPEQDVKEFNWYRKSAEQANVEAQYNLGQMYANGEGVPEDYVEAYAWLSIAATQADAEDRCRGSKCGVFGRSEAYATSEMLAKNHAENRLAKKEIVKAQALSAEYWENYVVPFQKE